MQTFLEYKKMIDYDTNLIMQKALSLYLDSGMFEKNLNYLSQVFHEQVCISGWGSTIVPRRKAGKMVIENDFR